MRTESKLNMTVSDAVQKWSVRRWLYPALLVFIVGSWFVYMVASNSWHLFQTYWPISLTMLFGSFVAGATPQGGAAVAFPVFTKVLRIPAADSRNFGFMIQAVGMMMAAVLIWTRRIKVLPQVILWVTLGGFGGALRWAHFGWCCPIRIPVFCLRWGPQRLAWLCLLRAGF